MKKQKMRRWLKKRRIKTPTVLQMEAVECGAASLAIILGYFGRIVPLEELRIACGVSRDGSKASNILRAARHYGLTARGFRKEPQRLRNETQMPVIIHWNFNHFLVLEGFDGDTVFLNDPAMGPRKVTMEEFNESFTGVAITFERGTDFSPGGKKPNLLKSLGRRLRFSKSALLYVFLVSFALVIPGLMIPAFARVFVDYYLVGGLSNWVAPLILGMLATAFLRMALTWLQQRYLLRLETKLALKDAGVIFWQILRLPISFFTQRSAGDISSRVGKNDRVAQLLSGELATTMLNLVLVIFYALFMFRYSPLLTGIGVLMSSLNFLILRYVSRLRVDANQKLIQEQGKLISTAYNGLQAIETIKATGMEGDFFARWSGFQAKMINAEQELGVPTQVVTAVPPILASLTNVLILCFGGFMVMKGQMTLGTLVAFQFLMSSFLAPIGQFVNLGSQLQEVQGIMNRLDDINNYRVDPQSSLIIDPEQLQSWDSYRLTGRVEIRDLTFGYNTLSEPLIKNFTLTVEPGMRVALVGGSGSGKSTVARLLAGLYEPWDGEILFDGKTRLDIPRPIINNSLSMVDQEIFLFEGSVRENILMWDETIAEEHVIQAAKDAVIHEIVAARPEGYDSPIEESGRNFSGGQRQRLEIARALVRNPSILIMDEATSALDSVTEREIDRHLRRRGCTCIIVAHRLSTIRDCDEIIVMDRGQIVQRGTHEKLWRTKGLYAELIREETPKSELLVDTLLESLYS